MSIHSGFHPKTPGIWPSIFEDRLIFLTLTFFSFLQLVSSIFVGDHFFMKNLYMLAFDVAKNIYFIGVSLRPKVLMY
jgi:hypothetical protein